MSKRVFRIFQNVLFLITTLVLFTSFYLQYFRGFVPCPLCVMQRICVFLLFMFCLMGMALSTLRRARVVTLFQLFFSLAGLFFAGRQLWLQSLSPESVPACMPGLDILIQYFPWQDVAHALLWGAGDCADASWRFLGYSMATWSACYFSFVFIVSAFLFWQLKNTGNHMLLSE